MENRRLLQLPAPGAGRGCSPSLAASPVHRLTAHQPAVSPCSLGHWWLFVMAPFRNDWRRKWGLHRAGEWLSSISELCVFSSHIKQYIPVPSWSRWWHRWTSKQVNWINTLSDGTNQGVKQESTLVQAANAVGVTSWSHALWEPDSLSELQKEDNKVVLQHF